MYNGTKGAFLAPPLSIIEDYRSCTNSSIILSNIIDIFLLNILNDDIENLKNLIASITNLEHTECS